MIRIITSAYKFKRLRNSKSFLNKSIGFVPTMGALHKGHIRLFRKSLQQNDITVVSIFVNPTQFSNSDDFQNYPKSLEQDINILKTIKVDYVFYPDYSEIYPDDFKYKIIETDFSKKLCGKFRPGHFEGVLTVVMKLLNIIKPHKAYFGEKDYQQLKLIEGMTKAFFLDTRIISVPTFRTKDGLALSSRNLRLNPLQKNLANEIPKLLSSGKSVRSIKNSLTRKGFRVEYVEKMNDRIFVAVYLGNVRLIDNVKI